MEAFNQVKEDWNETRDESVPDFDTKFGACAYCPQAQFSMVHQDGYAYVGVFCGMRGKDIDHYPEVCTGAEEEAEAY